MLAEMAKKISVSSLLQGPIVEGCNPIIVQKWLSTIKATRPDLKDSFKGYENAAPGQGTIIYIFYYQASTGGMSGFDNIMASSVRGSMMGGGDVEEVTDPIRFALVQLGLLRFAYGTTTWRVIVPNTDAMSFAVEVISKDLVHLHVTGLKNGAAVVAGFSLSEAESKLTESVDGGKIVVELKPLKEIVLKLPEMIYKTETFDEGENKRQVKRWKTFVFSYVEELGQMLAKGDF